MHNNPYRYLLCYGLALIVAAGATWAQSSSLADERKVVDVWPVGKMPGRGSGEPESDVPAKGDGVRRITNISRPTLTVFPARRSVRSPALAVIVCPGGGYNYLVYDKEGTAIASWLNANGISAFVLKYRVPDNREAAMQDIQRALCLVRARAAEWNVDPLRLGVMGFSAGGNLVARASTRFTERTYPVVDSLDDRSCRPDFAVLVYPAYLDDSAGHVAPDLKPSADTPPTFIIHSKDDKNFVAGSELYASALAQAGVLYEFKLYVIGGHGYGLRAAGEARAWPTDTLEWLAKMGFYSR